MKRLLNDIEFIAEQGELEDFAVEVAVEHLDITDISMWLERHSKC